MSRGAHMKINRAAVTVVAGTLLASAALMAVSTPVVYSAPSPQRTESIVHTSSPITSVIESVVRVKIPLPGSVGAHPAACDWLSYQRYRAADGPSASADAAKILIAQPGVLEGAAAFDSIARNTVAAAAAAGRHIEFWALDRRSNCLEDHTGIDAAIADNDINVAIDYYYRQGTVDGRRFAGFVRDTDLGWLSHIGVEQTVVDQFDLMVAELPDPALRRNKVLCGGHSLGGSLTAYFVQWDFDGQPGYQQCSGYFALDSTISTRLPIGDAPALTALLPPTPLGVDTLDGLTTRGLLPRSANLPALINPETMNLLGLVGAATHIDPSSETHLLKSVRNNNIDNSLRLLFSRDAVGLVTDAAPLRDIRLTNAALLGALMDNNSQPLAFLQTSVGMFDGGLLADKNFPVAHDLNVANRQITAGLLGPDPLVIPAIAQGPLYTWQNFNAVNSSAQLDQHGRPYTTPAHEVTDINDLARSLAEHPLDFTEQYFPVKLLIESGLGPSTAGIVNHLRHPQGLTARPILNLLGGSGITAGVMATLKDLPHVRTVIAPGYHHLDVLTAAAVQNNGTADPISTNLAEFAAR